MLYFRLWECSPYWAQFPFLENRCLAYGQYFLSRSTRQKKIQELLRSWWSGVLKYCRRWENNKGFFTECSSIERSHIEIRTIFVAITKGLTRWAFCAILQCNVTTWPQHLNSLFLSQMTQSRRQRGIEDIFVVVTMPLSSLMSAWNPCTYCWADLKT